MRFLPILDNLLLAYADRSRIVSEEYRSRLTVANGMKAAFLMDGFVRGAWQIRTERSTALLTLEPFAPLSASERAALEEEGAKLLHFAAKKADSADIRYLSNP
jgi:hypothetical protein